MREEKEKVIFEEVYKGNTVGLRMAKLTKLFAVVLLKKYLFLS